jgi:hypothetical protein
MVNNSGNKEKKKLKETEISGRFFFIFCFRSAYSGRAYVRSTPMTRISAICADFFCPYLRKSC